MPGVVPLRFRVGARTLFSIPRRLHRVALSLDQVLAGEPPVLPALHSRAQGLLVSSLPEALVAQAVQPGLTAFVRQRYTRYYADLGTNYEKWVAGLSGNTRSSLKRKRKKLLQHPDKLAVRLFRTPDDMIDFHALACPLAALTYQHRLLGAGLPDKPEFLDRMRALAAQDRVRAWLMMLGERPVAYLSCSGEGASLRYDYVGHDPALNDLSPGTVLHAAAFEALFAERRFARFDFTEGEGQHKRQFATGGVPCVDLLLLRPTIANHAALGALGGFDRAVTAGKRLAAIPGLAGWARRMRRA